MTKSKYISTHCVKSVRMGGFSGPHFPPFGLNTERYKVSFRIQSECQKMRTRITPNTDTFYALTVGLYIPVYDHVVQIILVKLLEILIRTRQNEQNTIKNKNSDCEKHLNDNFDYGSQQFALSHATKTNLRYCRYFTLRHINLHLTLK